MEQLDGIAFWLAIAAALFPIWGALIWEIWVGIVRPRRLPQTEIDALARQMIAKHGQQAPGAAFTREDRAWRTPQIASSEPNGGGSGYESVAWPRDPVVRFSPEARTRD